MVSSAQLGGISTTIPAPGPLNRVVVTGLGPISSVGIGIDAFWEGLITGKSGIGKINRWDAERFACQIGAEVADADFVPSDYFNSPKSVKSNDRATHFAVAASKLALDDARLDVGALPDATRIGVIVGSAFGGMGTFEEQTLKLESGGTRKVSPFTIPALLGNTHAGVVAIEIGAKGPNYGVVSACATGTHAIGEAQMALQRGDADVMVAGGCEAALTPLSFAGFCAMKAMCTTSNDNPTGGSRPFDATRAGFVAGEGAGVVVLETLEHALKRGAEIYCELGGYGATCDAHHITSPAPEGEGLGRAIAKSLIPLLPAGEGLGVEALLTGGEAASGGHFYYNAHGTSTAYNDKFETMALKGVFAAELEGDAAGAALRESLACSSTKSMTGHMLGAAGGIEAIICAKAIVTGVVPPTINYNDPDPECDLAYTPNEAATLGDITHAASGNLGFGGHNACLSFKKLS